MADIEPPKPQVSASRWHQPYSWLTAAAIGMIIFNIVIVVGFVRGFLLLPSILLQQYFEGTLVSANTLFQMHLIFVSVIIPIIMSAAGVALIFLKKPLAGIGVTFGAIAAHFVMDAVYISYIWDGHHVIEAYTHAAWLIRAVREYGGYSEYGFTFNFFYMPAMIFVIICLLKGWKKVKSP